MTPLPHNTCTPEGATVGFASEEITQIMAKGVRARGELNFNALQSLKQCVYACVLNIYYLNNMFFRWILLEVGGTFDLIWYRMVNGHKS